MLLLSCLCAVLIRAVLVVSKLSDLSVHLHMRRQRLLFNPTVSCCIGPITPGLRPLVLVDRPKDGEGSHANGYFHACEVAGMSIPYGPKVRVASL